MARGAAGILSAALTEGLGTRFAAAWAGGSDGTRPNILFALADDWGYPHAGAYGDPVVKTPTFDRLAREGVLFDSAFVASPSCTPSRSSILTGRHFWTHEEGSVLWGEFSSRHRTYPDALEAVGYHVGCTRKGWGPGQSTREDGRNPAGPAFADFATFLAARPERAPFCVWFGSFDPHRPYEKGTGVASGMELADVPVPACLPDNGVTRSDLCDYYFEVERFDSEVGGLIATLEEMGELDNTLVVMTGDNGIPFPRCKANLYDGGVRVPLAVRWGQRVPPGARVDDMVTLCDLAPTFLEAGGLEPPAATTGRSLIPILQAGVSGQAGPARNAVYYGIERHAWVREGGLGYPMRAVRTASYLYIRNYEPGRNPAGDPTAVSDLGLYGDIDNGPTKTYLLEHRDDPEVAPLFELACGKRRAEELYDLRADPDQLTNVADRPEHAERLGELRRTLQDEMTSTGDPRASGPTEVFVRYPYHGNVRSNPGGR